ncbi:SgcJ/EcaC family oxidoreductase [uncultured Mycobacterium sp.]|uniref:SgcJ/EcaC family oxidoreductase n=1 Tax=uncultured Mycobacterium sp. TaxID=171292 RepID=UPI0035CBDB67
MTTPKETVEEFVAAFVSAWPDRDAARVASFFSDDAVYHNIPMEPVDGRKAIEATLASFMTMGGQVRVDVGHIVAEGAIVMVERVDHFVGDQRTITLPVVGVFEVHDGKITAWRDYFDSARLGGAG